MVSSQSAAVASHQVVEVASDTHNPAAPPIPVSSIATLKVAINYRVKNKILPDDAAGRTRARWTFKNRELTPEGFIEQVSSGFAFCPWLSGSRHSSNFRCMQVLALDVDSGPTIEGVLANDFFQTFGWFIYTTFSHKPDAHRFRVVFLLAQPIDTAERMRQAYAGIRLMVGGGLCSKDVSRMFYGSENCEIYRAGHVLPVEQLESVIELGQTAIDCREYVQHLRRDSNRKWRVHTSDFRPIERKLVDACYSDGE
ncbi:hypothetical protein [Paraburkholderia aromaticivorans]|uniref:hypothetical protein n=1 Tax=Paraburkholderia aromaticivorans TaxID=2026199 RepID=UPI0038B70589